MPSRSRSRSRDRRRRSRSRYGRSGTSDLRENRYRGHRGRSRSRSRERDRSRGRTSRSTSRERSRRHYRRHRSRSSSRGGSPRRGMPPAPAPAQPTVASAATGAAPPLRSRGDEMRAPALHSIHRARIRNIHSYGAFAALEGFGRDGLIHVSQLADHRVEDPAQVVGPDQQVWVKVVALDTDTQGRPKISLSMKLVDQATGEDKDPLNERANGPGGRRGDGGGAGGEGGRDLLARQPIQLGAVLNTVCSRCGGRGHMRHECFNAVGAGSKYGLVGAAADDGRDMRAGAGGPASMRGVAPSGSGSGSGPGPGSGGGMGRGRGATLPAWMTGGAGAPPERAVDADGTGSFVEDGDAGGVAERADRERKAKKAKKEKHGKKHKKHKKHHKRHKHHKHGGESRRHGRSRSRSRSRSRRHRRRSRSRSASVASAPSSSSSAASASSPQFASRDAALAFLRSKGIEV